MIDFPSASSDVTAFLYDYRGASETQSLEEFRNDEKYDCQVIIIIIV